MWNIFFFKIQQFTIWFLLFFYYFWHFVFNFVYLYLSKKFRKFLCCFNLWIRDFIKEFWKIMEYFSKKYRHLKSKILLKFHRLLFVFLAFWTSFFPTSPIQTCPKILNIFVVLYCTDYRFFQGILENSRIFIKKNRDNLNTKHFQNSIVYYLFLLIC